METLLRDLKEAFRLLRGSPGFTTTAVAALALGIGANTAIFSVINTVLLKPLPYPDAARIVAVVHASPNGTGFAASVPKFNLWRRQTGIFDAVAAYDNGGPGINISGGERPEQVKGIHVSHEFFKVFGVPVALGRAFSEEEDRPRGGNVVVISDGLWHRRFAGDPGAVGKSIAIGKEPYTIVGVLGSNFTFSASPDLLLPFQADPNSTQHAHYFTVAARLKSGLGVAAANAELKLASDEFRRLFPGALDPRTSFAVVPLQDTIVTNVKTALYLLLGAVGFVLLIACANVANLQLARASGRAREIAIRTAIGAGRTRIIRQLLTESVVLSAVGGVLGLLIGVAGVRALLAVNPGNIPRIEAGGSGVSLDWTVLLFTFALAIVTGVLFGLYPAIHISRADLNAVLKESSSRSGASRGQKKMRAVLVVVEMALAIVLLVGAGLLIRTFAALHSVAPGFDGTNVLTLDTSLTGGRYDRDHAVADLARQAEERIEAIPGVQSAAATSYLPLEGGLGLPFVIEGRPLGNATSHGGAGWAYVSHRFFEVFRIAIVRGRGFSERDNASAPGVVMINEAFARQFFANENPVGKRITVGGGSGIFAEPPREIVGVFSDMRDAGLNSDPQPEMFTPLPQVKETVLALNNRFMPMSWVVRTVVPPFSVASQIQRVFQDLADLPAAHPRTMAQVVVQSTARDQFNTLLLGIFAVVAIILASIGLYGVMAYSVEQRTLEFGIRLALGADGHALRNMVVGQAMKLAALGIVLGLAGSYGLTRFMVTMLYGVKPTDAMVFGAVAALLAVVAVLASYLPARRATGIDPVIALRAQ